MSSTRRSVAEAAGLVWHAGPMRAVCHALVTFAQAAPPVAVAWLTKLVLDELVRGATVAELTVLLVPLVVVRVAIAALPQLSAYIGAELGRRVPTYALDRLYVAMKRIAELGRHDELMAANGLYARLFRIQASGYQDEAVPRPGALPDGFPGALPLPRPPDLP